VHERFAVSSRSPPIFPVTTSSPKRIQRSTARSASRSSAISSALAVPQVADPGSDQPSDDHGK